MNLVKTDDIATDAELADFYADDDDYTGRDEPICVCAGEWRREMPGKWRFWRDPSFAAD